MPMAIPIIMMVGAVMQAKNAADQGKGAEAVGNYNATLAEQNAQVARQETQFQIRQQDRETYMRLGAIKAASAKNGGTMAGSALDVLADTAYQSAWEKATIEYAGELKARGFENTATLDRMRGRVGLDTGNTQAASDLLQGAGKSYMAYKSLNQNPPPQPPPPARQPSRAGDDLDV